MRIKFKVFVDKNKIKNKQIYGLIYSILKYEVGMLKERRINYQKSFELASKLRVFFQTNLDELDKLGTEMIGGQHWRRLN